MAIERFNQIGRKMIVYPGVLERIEEQRRFWEAIVDEQIKGLDSAKRAKVSDACTSCGLNSSAIRDVLATTCELIKFEENDRDRVLTDAQKFEIIEYIRDTAYSLAGAIEVLPQLTDGLKLKKLFRNVSKELGELERMKLDSQRMPDPLILAVLGEAADRMLTARRDLEGKGGRRNLRKYYGQFIASLASAFDGCGLPVGRGGAFERLCTVVFDVSGVRATPEGAIRYYLCNRKKPDNNLMENSGI